MLSCPEISSLQEVSSRLLRLESTQSVQIKIPSVMLAHGLGFSYGHSGGRNTRGSCYCDYRGCTNHVSEKCWNKFSKLNWATCHTNSTSARVPESSSLTCDTVTLNCQDYDRMMNNTTASPAANCVATNVIPPNNILVLLPILLLLLPVLLLLLLRRHLYLQSLSIRPKKTSGDNLKVSGCHLFYYLLFSICLP